MTGARLNNIYTYIYENINWSAAERIAATALPVLNPLPVAPAHKLPSVEREGLALNILQKFT